MQLHKPRNHCIPSWLEFHWQDAARDVLQREMGRLKVAGCSGCSDHSCSGLPCADYVIASASISIRQLRTGDKLQSHQQHPHRRKSSDQESLHWRTHKHVWCVCSSLSSPQQGHPSTWTRCCWRVLPVKHRWMKMHRHLVTGLSTMKMFPEDEQQQQQQLPHVFQLQVLSFQTEGRQNGGEWEHTTY